MTEKWIELDSMIDVGDLSKAISKFESNLKKRLKVFRKRFRDLKKLLIDEITDFKKIMNENLASIFLMFLNDRSRRLRTLEDEKNENEKTLKSCRFELGDAKRFINKRTLMMKWETAVLKSFDSWVEDLLNRSSVNRFENDLSSENYAEEDVSWMRTRFRDWNKKTDAEIETNNNETMKRIDAIVETNEKMIKENWMLCAWKRCRYFLHCLMFYVYRSSWVLIKEELNKLLKELKFARNDMMMNLIHMLWDEWIRQSRAEEKKIDEKFMFIIWQMKIESEWRESRIVNTC